MTRIAFRAVLVFILTQVLAGGGTSLAADAAKSTASAKTKSALRIDDMYPVYGVRGCRRHKPFVAGERIFFAAKISGIHMTPGRDLNPGYVYGISCPSGNDLAGAGDGFDNEGSFPLGDGDAVVYFSFQTKMSASKGRYRVHLSVCDIVRTELAKKSCEVEVLDRDHFCILNAGLYRDENLLHASGGNVTVGERIGVRFDVRVPKDKYNSAAVRLSVTVFDRHNRAVCEFPPVNKSESNLKNGIQFVDGAYFDIGEIGSYRVHIEAKDLSTNQVEVCDLPVVVHPLPGISPIAAESVATDRGKKTLSIDAYPTSGCFGGPTDNVFMRGEKVSLAAICSGLARNADQKTDCTLAMCMLAPDSSVCVKDEKAKEIRAALYSDACSVTSSLIWECPRKVTPGRYTVRLVAKDHIADSTASREVPITITDENQFGLGCFRLSADREGRVSVGHNLTVGEPVAAICRAHVPERANSHDVEIIPSFQDHNRKQITVWTASRFRRSVTMPYGAFICPFVPNRAGSYYLHVELRDTVTKETVTKEMPFNVFLPPENEKREAK
ncbi:MAG: hypothetical protein ABFC96_15565 [Thermoguttaceae bacterium]